jgi:hypothetical protein
VHAVHTGVADLAASIDGLRAGLRVSVSATAGPTPGQPGPVFRIDSLVVPWGDTTSARVTGVASGTPISWRTTDASIASVDSFGVVTGRAEGTTLLIAVSNGVQVAANVRVELRLKSLSVGYTATCGVVASNTVLCWNLLVPLFDVQPAIRLFSYADAQAGGFDGTQYAIGRGGSYVCGLTALGGVECSGHSGVGQGGKITAATDKYPVHIPVPVTRIRTGSAHTCALTIDDAAYCWGFNQNGQIGARTEVSCDFGFFRIPNLIPCTDTAVHTQPALHFRDLRVGGQSTCGIIVDGSVRCWGLALLPSTSGAVTGIDGYAVAVPPNPIAVAVGETHACALTAAGEAWCWGRNAYGQLGLGATDSLLHAPAAIPGMRFRSIAAGGNSVCGVTTENVPYCWGANANGQLGDGTHTDRPSPVRVSFDGPASAVGVNLDHSCLLNASGAPYCWGTVFNSTSPVPLLPP